MKLVSTLRSGTLYTRCCVLVLASHYGSIMAYCSTFTKAKTNHYGPDCQTDASFMKFLTHVSLNGFGFCQQDRLVLRWQGYARPMFSAQSCVRQNRGICRNTFRSGVDRLHGLSSLTPLPASGGVSLSETASTCECISNIIFGCPTRGILVLPPGIKDTPHALEVQSLNHWTAREVLWVIFLIYDQFFFVFFLKSQGTSLVVQ